MSKITERVEQKILPAVNKFAKQKYLQAISSAFMSTMAAMMIGGIALLIIEPPVDYNTLTGVLRVIMKAWADIGGTFLIPFLTIFNMTMGMTAVYATAGIGYFLSKHYKMDGFLPIISCLLSFFILAGIDATGEMTFTHFGGTGLFTAILSSILTIEVFRFLLEKKFGLIEIKSKGVPPAIAQSFAGLVPIAVIVLAASFIGWGIISVSGVTLPDLIGLLIAPLINSINSVWALIFFSVLVLIFWWFGIHDSAITGPLETIWAVMGLANLAAYEAGTSLTQVPYVFTNNLWWIFMTLGGSGATLGLCLLLLFSKSKQLKTVGRLALVPSLFNINEPIIFGLPIMLNPLMFVPFVGAMTINGVITYMCMQANLVNSAVFSTGWNMPAPIAAFISTMDWRAVVLVLGLIVLDAFIWLPFIRVYEKQKLLEESQQAGE